MSLFTPPCVTSAATVPLDRVTWKETREVPAVLT